MRREGQGRAGDRTRRATALRRLHGFIAGPGCDRIAHLLGPARILAIDKKGWV